MASEDEVCRAETEGTSLALPEDIDARVEILEVDEPPVLSPVENFPHLAHAVQDAGLSLVRSVLDAKLPWELPGLDLVFGKSLPSLPQSSSDILPTAVPFPLKESLEEAAAPNTSEQRAKKARTSISLGVCFRDVINFNLVETDSALEEVKWTRALETWLEVIMEGPDLSSIGVKISGKPGSDALKNLRELFGRKSSSTVAKRGSALQKYVRWLHRAFPGQPALPFTCQHIDEYLESLQEQRCKPGAFTSFTEAVNFGVHVVGLPINRPANANPFQRGAAANQILSPWARGAVALEMQKKAERVQSAVLSADAVVFLENFLADTGQDPVDRYAAGSLLFAVFSRSRISDLRKVRDWHLDFSCIKSHGQGFLECSTRSHKTARDVAASGLAMPLVAPALGLRGVSWAVVFTEVASSVGLGFEDRGEGPLLPAPDQGGGWLSRSVTTAEAGAWLRQILSKGSMPSEGVTGHSLKSTTLSWCSKFGMDKHTRLQLGHHATGDGTLNTYGRDFLAPALRKYDDLLSAIRKGTFYPDLTRSGRVNPAADAVKVEVSDDEAMDFGLPSFASEDSFEKVLPTSVEDDNDANGGKDASSSDSGSSQDEVLAGVEHSESEGIEPAFSEAKPKPSWEPGYNMYKHVRTHVLHLSAQGSSSGVFACGRKMTTDFKLVEQAKFLSLRKCKTCEGAKPLRDTGALVQAVNALRQRKDVAESSERGS